MKTLYLLLFKLQSQKSATSQPVLCAEKVRNQWMLARQIVKSAKYRTTQMQYLWELLTTHHKEDLDELIKLAQIALILPLHTASCERVFSQQNIYPHQTKEFSSTENIRPPFKGSVEQR